MIRNLKTLKNIYGLFIQILNTYNPSYDMIAIVEALIEFPPSGGVKPSYSIKTFRATDNWTIEDKSRASMETGLTVLIAVLAFDLIYNWFLEFSMPVDEFAMSVKDFYDTDARRKMERRERRKMNKESQILYQNRCLSNISSYGSYYHSLENCRFADSRFIYSTICCT